MKNKMKNKNRNKIKAKSKIKKISHHRKKIQTQVMIEMTT